MTAGHTLTPYLNPHMACSVCHWDTPAWHNPEACPCGTGVWSDPCGHVEAVYSRCRTWDGTACRCAEQDPPHVDHPPARTATDNPKEA